MNATVVVNPAARGGAHTRAAERAVARLTELGIATTTVSGASAAESTALLRQAVGTGIGAGTDAVIVVGGDGIINLALQEVAGTATPLGVVPAGNGNDFAREFGIPELEPEIAADIIAAGHTRTIDLARTTRADGTTAVFGTVLASGFDSYVNDRANRMRILRGDARYKLAIAIEFFRLRGIHYAIEVDGVRLEGDFLMASVGNTRNYGGGIPICADADPSDGLLDVTLVRPGGRLRLLRLLPKVYAGAHMHDPQVQTLRGASIRMDAPGLQAYADGDPLGYLPLTIETWPAAQRVFVAPSS